MTRNITKKKYLTTVAGAALLAIGGAGTAHAVPVYAFANVIVTNFVLQGIADVSGNPLPGVTINSPTLTTSDAATYPGFPAEAFSQPGSLITGSDVLQAAAGPSAFPPQNFFGQALLLGAGSRGDAIMRGGSLFQAATSSNVSESNLGTAAVNVVPNTSNASSNAGFSLDLTIAMGSAVTLNLSFTGSDSLLAATAPGGAASAQVSTDFHITDSAGVYFDFAPLALNDLITASNGTSTSFDTPATFYNTTIVLLPNTYLITWAPETATNVEVPEPASLLLFGVGLTGLALTRRRKSARQNPGSFPL